MLLANIMLAAAPAAPNRAEACEEAAFESVAFKAASFVAVTLIWPDASSGVLST